MKPSDFNRMVAYLAGEKYLGTGSMSGVSIAGKRIIPVNIKGEILDAIELEIKFRSRCVNVFVVPELSEHQEGKDVSQVFNKHISPMFSLRKLSMVIGVDVEYFFLSHGTSSFEYITEKEAGEVYELNQESRDFIHNLANDEQLEHPFTKDVAKAYNLFITEEPQRRLNKAGNRFY